MVRCIKNKSSVCESLSFPTCLFLLVCLCLLLCLHLFISLSLSLSLSLTHSHTHTYTHTCMLWHSPSSTPPTPISLLIKTDPSVSMLPFLQSEAEITQLKEVINQLNQKLKPLKEKASLEKVSKWLFCSLLSTASLKESCQLFISNFVVYMFKQCHYNLVNSFTILVTAS